nr:AAA family ATPase [Gulosibacter molinativorax]
MVALDGRSGSGKTTLADQLARRTGCQVLHVENFYPGWEGLDAGSEYLVREVLVPLREGKSVRTHRWDWHVDQFFAGALIEPAGLIVIEGCGAISNASRPLLDVAIWLEADERIRRARATTRDGDESWWLGWQAQEDAFYTREQSDRLADYVLDADATADDVLALLRGERG